SAPSLPSTKKLSSRVRPGVTDTRARLVRPVSALRRLDLPTLDRPAKATSARPSRGRSATRVTPLTKVQGPLNSASPLARSAEVNAGSSIVIAGLDPGIQGLRGLLTAEGGGYWIARPRGQ